MKKNKTSEKSSFEELNIMELIILVWLKKRIVFLTIFVAIVLGILYYLNKPNVYQISSKISLPDRSHFIKYKTLNDLFIFEDIDDSFLIGEESIYNHVVGKMSSFSFTYKLLENSNFIEKLDIELSDNQKINLINNLAKSYSSMNKGNLVFHWNKIDEGKKILELSLEIILEEAKKILIGDMKQAIKSVEEKNNNVIKRINNTLENIVKEEHLNIDKKLLFLNEQLYIAQKLDIDINTGVENFNFEFKESLEDTNRSFQIDNSNGYYLRGYKAIEMEIEALLERKNEDKYILYENYVKNKNQISRLENKIIFKQLNEQVSILEKESPRVWISYDFDFAQVIPINRSVIFIIIFSGLLGLFFGVFYILISNALKNAINDIKIK